MIFSAPPPPEPEKSWKPAWMHSDHYHCKDCNVTIQCSIGLEWKVNVGVRRVGFCRLCGQMLVESEHGGVSWPDIKV